MLCPTLTTVACTSQLLCVYLSTYQQTHRQTSPVASTLDLTGRGRFGPGTICPFYDRDHHYYYYYCCGWYYYWESEA